MKVLGILLALSFMGIIESQQRPSTFRYGQRYPNEDEYKACGQIRDVIPRNSGRFRKIIIRNLNNDAQYANDDCRRMTARTKSKLDILASRVKAHWRGPALRVLRAWTDQVDPNDKLSLHYEGRSVRLQTSDGDRHKLGRLAGLALEAGFDWVGYKNYDYIRASVVPDVCQTSVDLVFLLDGSGSVGRYNFDKVKEFVKKVVDFFNIGTTGTHIAVVKYSTRTNTEFRLNQYFTKSELKQAVDSIFYRGGATYTAEALRHLSRNIFTQSAGMRTDPGIPKVLVLLTDGHSQGASVGPPAQELKNIGVGIFGIGVGNGISVSQLNDISSDPDSDYVFHRTFDNLIAGWVDRLSAVSCSEGSLIDACKEVETSVESGSFKYFRTQFQFVTGNQVSVELRDRTGISHLYASRTNKNPGPLDSASVKNEDNTSPKAVSVEVDNSKTVFVAVQGQKDKNTFTLSFWDNLFAQPTYTIPVQENQNAKFIKALRMATNNRNFEYTITDGNIGNAFRIDSDAPNLRTTKRLDRENIAKYSLVVVAQSLSNKCHKSRTNVIVTVTDENDNSPTFTENPYRASILETTRNGALVKQVLATDRDSGVNSKITYSITSQTPETRFVIDQQGRITLTGAVDYERYSSYTLNLQARDGGGRTDTSQLHITVQNVNERPSIKCNNGNCKYSVNENVQRGTGFGAKVIGTDPDTKTSCVLQYSLPSSVKTFSVHRTTGVILTNGDLDREKQSSYRFSVTVRDCGGLTNSIYVTVTVKDLNDNSPAFPGSYMVSILESEQPGSNVVQVRATDADEGNNARIAYTIVGSESSAFAINSANGKITTKTGLDFEQKRSYRFEVVATDGGGLQGRQTVAVYIVDVNDNAPIFGIPYSKSISEGARVDANVITVKATDRDSGDLGDIRYSIFSGNIGNAFAINALSGLITVKSKLDRETSSSYKLIVQASDRGPQSLHARATVTITIEDINDNSPVFQGEPYKRSVPEDFSTNSDLLKVTATDKDIGENGKITYSIKSPQIAKENFKIDANNGNIRLKKALDYEGTKEYTFTVAARDGPGKEDTAQVKISVEDVNDNTPTFQGSPYTANVAENVRIGYVVGTVKATDADSGPRGRVSYSITSGANNAFRINAAGSVTVASSLDRETKDNYILIIKAQDDGQPSKYSTAQFTITVTDINDNAPKFGKSSYSFKIAENNSLDARVGQLGQATDLDVGVNAQIVYSIVSGNEGTAFEFKNNGDLIAKKSLDRETKDSYSLVIEARDRGQSPLFTRVSVNVVVEDKNDNTPSFDKNSYVCSIDENSAKNSGVCFVRATDKDIGINGKVVYELVSSSNEFSVFRDNGEIRTKISLDREKTPSFTFKVLAKDGGNPSRQSEVTVTVNVIDKNDNEPQFNKDQYSFQIKEDANVKDSVGQVSASDKDEGLSGTVVYSIISGNTKSAFSINKNSGAISVASALDRETLANYKLTIRASDRGNPELSSRKDVLIKILDVNDNDPIFTKQIYSGRISEDAAVGSRVVQVKATDKDEGLNGKIKYSITAGVKKEHFAIDEDTGMIKTAAKLDYETKTSYQLTVKATDQGTPKRSSSSQVNIEVKNTNDNAPTFVPGSPIVYVSEAVAIGTKVVKFNATDQDGNKLTFSISEGNTNNALVIDKDTGLLTTKTKLDRETVARYNLTVTVTESTDGQGAQSSSQNLSVVVTDENDNMPLFDPDQYSVDVDENKLAGVLVTVNATDLDEGKNAEISYSLDSVSATKFIIDSKTGVISTKAPLDHEESSSYDITVTARDGGTSPLSSTASVKVTVNDLNDNKPRFAKDYTTTLRENTAKGRIVLRVEASDPDSAENGNISYTIKSGNNLGYFSLNNASGVIRVEKPPDREQNPSFTLTIEATNKPPFAEAPAAKTTCSVSITIEDANDNAPIITTIASPSVPENSPANRQVLDVDATDADAGNNSKIVYAIVQGNIKDAFRIDADSGVISTQGVIDHETISSYTLKVQASDEGSPSSLFSTKDFVVGVIDLDDNAPVFDPDSYDVSVPESANLSTPVVHLKATDKDTGNYAKLRYSIASGNDQDHFRIDSDSGIIYTKASLDYETLKQYTLVVEAKDTKHTSRANVSIRVEDVNDNNPIFNPKVYKIDIPENQSPDNKILTVKATDKDPFGGLTYSFVPPLSNVFSVDPPSGDISPVSELDRETTDYYNLTVRVTDGGSPGLSDNAVVEIRITDVNDNRPKFNSSREDISVLENSPIGKVLFKVAATDEDIGVNAELRYTIKRGNEEAMFKLDADTGLLTVLGNIDREKVVSFRLEIIAEDKGSPKLKSTPLVVAVTVLDENDNDPLFTESGYKQNITENLSSGFFVKEFEAIDADIGANGQVTYAILSGDRGYFRIENETGIVRTTKSLDREDIASFDITIIAKDQGNPSRNSTTILKVNVLDANDNSPRLDNIVANVTEEQPKGQFVTRVVAVDPDEGMNGEIEYSLTIRGSQALNIDPKTGVITTKVKFDYEEQRSHTFKIIATDKGNPPLSTTADLMIIVLDIDDNCPVFDPKEYNVTVQENLPYGEEIVQVFAEDVDTVGGSLKYGIRDGNIDSTFFINASAGILRAGRSVDREVAAEYNLIIRAGNDYCGVNKTDIDDETTGSELSKSIAKVNVFLTDVNDNAPVFLKDSYEYELTDIYTRTLLWLNATDPDEGVNAQFDFALHGVTRNGAVREVVITATDKGTPTMTSNTTLRVTGVECEAMRFYVSNRGQVTADTLCQFDKILVPEDAFVSQRATFNCSAQGNTVAEYRWYHNSLPITDWLKSGEYVIKNLTKNDEGQYTCVASSQAGNILSKAHKFSVKEPAKVIDDPKDAWVEEGEKAVLSCRATGDSPIKYKWYKNNVLVQSNEDVTADGKDLVMKGVIRTDEAEYYCEVSNYDDDDHARPDKCKSARIKVYLPDAVVELELTVNKPRPKESCQYFNMTAIEETITGLIGGEVAVVEFEKPDGICNLTACSSDPCFNNGICQTKGSDYVCLCPREWTGKQCQIDVDECTSAPCKNGTCVNKQGSFACECDQPTFKGKFCQLKDEVCNSANCTAQETCYPKEVVKGYECLAEVRTVTMTFRLDEARRPFEDWMKYDIAKEIENAINDAAVIQTRDGGRTRRATTTVDYSSCSVRINRLTNPDAENVNLDIILVCAQPPKQEYVCDAMLMKDMVTSCTDENGTREPKPKTDPPSINPERVTLAFVVRRETGKDTEASETVRILEEKNFEDKLKKYSMGDVSLKARSVKKAESGESNSGLSSGAVTGVVIGCIVFLTVSIMLAVLLVRKRRDGGKQFSIGNRAMLSRTQSTDAIVSRDISMRELENAETRGVNNRTFSEIYEEHEGRPQDLEDGTFMVDNPQLALRKNDKEYIKELDSSPWFHGSISRAKAEEILDATNKEGTFLVRSGLDMNEFYISVRTPNAEPKFRHISVNRRDEKFVAVCGSEARNFTTFNELIDYLRANPTKMEGISEDVILNDPVTKA